MEKDTTQKPGRAGIKQVVITGPESTGKTTLTQALAKHFNTVYVPEMARSYVLDLKGKYQYEDVEAIANWQMQAADEYLPKANGFLFFDTFLIITKIWFIWCYKRYPQWIDKELEKHNIDLFLLCQTDLPWVPDEVRENGGENRDRLFHLYQQELENFTYNYAIISGTNEERLSNALNAIESKL